MPRRLVEVWPSSTQMLQELRGDFESLLQSEWIRVCSLPSVDSTTVWTSEAEKLPQDGRACEIVLWLFFPPWTIPCCIVFFLFFVFLWGVGGWDGTVRNKNDINSVRAVGAGERHFTQKTGSVTRWWCDDAFAWICCELDKICTSEGVYTVNKVPGLKLRDKLSVCVSVASWRNNSILNTTFYVSAQL